VVGVSEKVRITVTVEPVNADYLDRETNNRSAFINELIEAHRKGVEGTDDAIARYRKEQIESELQQVESREETLRSQLESVEKQLTSRKEHREEQLSEARDVLADVPPDPENAAVENWARKLDMAPEELLEVLENE
jgi:hypothetical protein